MEFFSTILLLELASELTTKDVAREIIQLLSKFQKVSMNQKKVTNFFVTTNAAQTGYTAFVVFYFVAHLFIASWKLYESYR